MNKELDNRFVKFLNDNYWYNKRDKSKEIFEFDIYVDYRDELDDHTIREIFDHDNPQEYLDEQIFDWYRESEWEIIDQLRGELEKEVGEIDDDDWFELVDEHVIIVYPFDRFLSQPIQVNIFVDTGDGNYDFILNAHWPHYNGIRGEKFDKNASLVWLAKQQGYTKTQLEKFVNSNPDFHDPKGFLESVVVELANMTTHMPCLTFMVEMTVEECFALQERIKKSRTNDDNRYDATTRPNVGYITLAKNTECGLYDPWQGGGSVLEIQLEKDVNLPIRYIRSALPDGCDGYQIADCYGLSKDFWRRTTKAIH